MLVTFVSQCEKKALKRTRRILDAFANRIGSNVWQTAITEEGLMTVKRLLRQSATRSTAVSCHRVRTRQRTELVWIVGNKRKFNEVGFVAVNSTKRNILHSEWENDWTYASSIQIIATLAALLHDIGKSTKGFQNKLNTGSKTGDPYRHEWISLKLFSLMIQGCTTDSEWLNRFINLSEWLTNEDIEKQISQLNPDTSVIGNMPPLAQWVAWLIVTHHRLPPLTEVFISSKSIIRAKENSDNIDLTTTLFQFYDRLTPTDYWVKNPRSIDEMTAKQLASFWQFNNLVIHSTEWQKTLKRWSKKALNDPTLSSITEYHQQNSLPISDTILMQLSRLCLMVGDHNYSSLKTDDPRCIKVKETFSNLAANTDRSKEQPVIKQTLEEHLIGVSSFTAHFARILPIVASEMPRLANHDPFAKPTGKDRFKWQNKAFKLANELRDASTEHGFFGVNMASTGAGKTIGNARIMYGLADPKKGARFTIALGLRVLTLQTGLSFRENLGLKGDQLAILVGGSAHKKLFEMSHDAKTGDLDKITNEVDSHYDSQAFGSESSEDLIDEFIDSDIDYADYDDLNLGTVVASPKARDLLFAPIVTCTVDHIIQASENKRGGKHIAPLLRLLSSDLILDEPDDFDQADLPALSRLMHLAGLMGTRVLLSSATLTPDLVTGLFEAYLTGRELFNNSQNKPSPKVVCAWFDENEKSMISQQCGEIDDFYQAHNSFSQKRASYLAKQPIRRKAEILPLSLSYSKSNEDTFYNKLAQSLVDGAIKLHNQHHITDDQLSAQVSAQKVSIGLIRIANINNINAIAKQLLITPDIKTPVSVPSDTMIHVTVYHAKQLLLLRNSLENKLDRILNRNDGVTPITHKEVAKVLAQHSGNSAITNHIFIVLATPVAEVGRDHDYDWAIVEPSSMRSIIQLAGRIWRHRPDKIANSPNMLLIQYNLNHYKRRHKGALVFTRPGFETANIQPEHYDLNGIIPDEQLAHIDARPRIINTLDDIDSHKNTKAKSLSELEHRVMRQLLNNPALNYVNAYWDGEADSHRAHTHLQQITPFRAGTTQEDWLLIPRMVHDHEDTDYPSEGLDAYYSEEVFGKGLHLASPHNKEVEVIDIEFTNPSIRPWIMTSIEQELKHLQHKQPDKSLRSLAITYLSASLEKSSINQSRGWAYHPLFGFMRQ